jgi:hypothetical protein
MNLVAAARFGTTRPSVPLTHSASIHHGNALQTDWAQVLPPAECSFIVGNPPFVGYSYQSKEQKADLERVYQGAAGTGVLDFVAAWYVLAARYMQANPAVHTAFVSTNSLSQGEQVAALWGQLLPLGAEIHFAHRTFKWSNEGKGVAAVPCSRPFRLAAFGITAPTSKAMAWKYKPPASILTWWTRPRCS